MGEDRLKHILAGGSAPSGLREDIVWTVTWVGWRNPAVFETFEAVGEWLKTDGQEFIDQVSIEAQTIYRVDEDAEAGE